MEELVEQLRKFAMERDWEQFHSPKNLAMALSAETAEILEIFQWLTERQSRELDDTTRNMLAEEIGDVMNYLTLLGDKFGINPVEAAKYKIVLNEKKYPVHKARGKALKYDRLQDAG